MALLHDCKHYCDFFHCIGDFWLSWVQTVGHRHLPWIYDRHVMISEFLVCFRVYSVPCIVIVFLGELISCNWFNAVCLNMHWNLKLSFLPSVGYLCHFNCNVWSFSVCLQCMWMIVYLLSEEHGIHSHSSTVHYERVHATIDLYECDEKSAPQFHCLYLYLDVSFLDD